MRQGILKFSLPEEQVDFERACNAAKLTGLVWDISEWLRTLLQHGHEFKTPDEALQAMADYVQELRVEYNISKEMLNN